MVSSGFKTVIPFCHTATCCPGITPVKSDDPKNPLLGVIVTNATPAQAKQMGDQGLKLGQGETAGVLPLGVLIKAATQLMCDAGTLASSGQSPQKPFAVMA